MMKNLTVDERSLKVIQDWHSMESKNVGQHQAQLQCLINSALEEQDRMTRHNCALAVDRLALDHYTIMTARDKVIETKSI
jgi:hypothetical protein